jgi:hypothetical protein
LTLVAYQTYPGAANLPYHPHHLVRLKGEAVRESGDEVRCPRMTTHVKHSGGIGAPPETTRSLHLEMLLPAFIGELPWQRKP